MPRATDICWRGQWYRPGPIFQARALGLWPDEGNGVWAPALFEACCQGPEPAIPHGSLPEIGCDCATGKGDDFHAIHARWGPVSVHHETANTMDPSRIYDRLRHVCTALANRSNECRDPAAHPIEPRQLRIKLDDDGTGNAVGSFLKRDGYNAILVSAASRAANPNVYHRRRDELWFLTAGKAREGLVYFGRLDKATRARLRQQLLAPAFELQQRSGLLLVEDKQVTKDKIKRSPDDADATNLAYLDSMSMDMVKPLDNPPNRMPWMPK
jgi:hypothetical protein